jgi:hypothetical protein
LAKHDLVSHHDDIPVGLNRRNPVYQGLNSTPATPGKVKGVIEGRIRAAGFGEAKPWAAEL